MFSPSGVTACFCIHCKNRKKDKGQSKLILLKSYSRNITICFFLPSHSVVGLTQEG